MKKTASRITALLCAAMLAVAAGCDNGGNTAQDTASASASEISGTADDISSEEDTSPRETTTTEEVIEEGEILADDEYMDGEYDDLEFSDEGSDEDLIDAEGEKGSTAAGTISAPGVTVNVAALKGPTAMGMIKMMDTADNDPDSGYEFSVYASPDELTPLIIQGKVDVACVPANLASVLYNKTEGEIEVLALNTLGVLYIVENGTNEVNSIADLKGKTIYASGQGSTPEFALNYLLEQNGIADDVTIEWKSEHTECLTAITSAEGGIAMLPQPFVTTAQTKNDKIRVAADLTEEWNKLGNGSTLITGVVIASKEFVENESRALIDFLINYDISVNYVNNNTDQAAALIGKYDIVPEAVAKKALPECNIVFIPGSRMKEQLSGYLQVLYDSQPASIGGKLPEDDFYYTAFEVDED